MNVLKCKMCGGDLNIQEETTVCRCDFCGTNQTIPTIDSEKKTSLFARANRLRMSGEFDRAAVVYENIVSEFPEEAEAYWGVLLCEYGIEYVDDPDTGEKVPTCHRSSYESILEDDYFDLVMENSDPISRRLYRDEAKKIEDIRISIINISMSEEAYDIFICYKEKDEYGERTEDSVLAQDTYDKLTEKGYKVFFSRISLEDKIGEEYEPYIFAALNSAKIMLVFGSDYENFNAVWVKNEWMRFLKLIESDKEKVLIPCFKGIDAYDIPKEFVKFQAQDMGKIGALQDLIHGIDKILNKKDVQQEIEHKTSSFVQRGNIALEDKDFPLAAKFFEKALDDNPADGYAYLGRFLIQYKVSSISELKEEIIDYESNKDFHRAQLYADRQLKGILDAAIALNDSNIEKKKREKEAYINKKKKVLAILLANDKSQIAEAEVLFNELKISSVNTEDTYSLPDMFSIVSHLGMTLSENKVHPIDSLLMAYGGEKKDLIAKILNELESFGFIEEVSPFSGEANSRGYCLSGVKEEYEKEQKRIEEEKKERVKKREAYENECKKIDALIQEELKPIILKIDEEYDPQIKRLKTELGSLKASSNQERVKKELELMQLKGKKTSIGAFNKKRAAEIQNEIVVLEKQLEDLSSSQQINAEYNQQIDDLIAAKKAQIVKAENEARSKYKYPNRADFI